MSASSPLQQLQQSPEFNALIRKRLRVCIALSAIMVGFYSSFYLCMAYLPGFMASRISDASVVTVGLIYGIASMLLAVVLSGYYAWWSTNRYEVLKETLVKELLDEQE